MRKDLTDERENKMLDRTEPNRTEPNRTEPNRTEPNRLITATTTWIV